MSSSSSPTTDDEKPATKSSTATPADRPRAAEGERPKMKKRSRPRISQPLSHSRVICQKRHDDGTGCNIGNHNLSANTSVKKELPNVLKVYKTVDVEKRPAFHFAEETEQRRKKRKLDEEARDKKEKETD